MNARKFTVIKYPIRKAKMYSLPVRKVDECTCIRASGRLWEGALRDDI